MSLLFVEGFDHYGTTSKIIDSKKWTSGAAISASASLSTGRYSGNSLKMTSPSCQLIKYWGSNDQSFTVGFAFKVTSLSTYANSGDILFECSDDGSYSQFAILLTETGALQLVSGGVLGTLSLGYTVKDTTAHNLTPNTWHYIEIQATIADTGGRVIIHVDETVWMNYTGDTKRSSNAYANRFVLEQPSYMGDCYFDDLYLANDTTFRGECRVCTLLPTADTASADWTAQGGASHYAEVDDTTLDDDTTYIKSQTVGHIDRFGFGNLPSTGLGNVLGVQVVSRCRKDDANARQIKHVIKSGGSTINGAAYNLSTGYVNHTDMLLVDPDTSAAWLKTAVDAAEFGVEVTA